MRMENKSVLFVAAVMLGALLIVLVGRRFLEERTAMGIAVFWGLGSGAASFFIPRCPHYGKPAMIKPNWAATPFVGDHCRYCGKEY